MARNSSPPDRVLHQLVGPPPAEQEPGQPGPDLVAGRGGRGPGDVLHHGQPGIEKAGLLRQVADRDRGPRLARGGRDLARDRPQQGGLARPVPAGHGDPLGPAHGQLGASPVPEPDAGQREDRAPGGHRRLRHVDPDLAVVPHGFLGGRQPFPGVVEAADLGAAELGRGDLGLPFARLHHGPGLALGVVHLLAVADPPVELDPGPGQVALLPPHVGFGGPDGALGGLLLGGHRGLVAGEAAAEPAQVPVAQLADLIGQLQQLTVVAGQHQGAGPGADGVEQPVPGREVEVAGRLVQEQHRGPAQELGGQAQQHRLPAGQLTDAAVQRHVLEAQPVQRGPGPLLGVPVAADQGKVLLARVAGLDRAQGGQDGRDAERFARPGGPR